MATRSNIVVEYGSSIVYIYRHWDGYPSETGADLARKLEAARGCAHNFVESLLSAKRDGADTRSQYELTNSIHGDIEWLYRVRFPHYGAAKIGLCKIAIGTDRPDTAASVNLHSLTDFVKYAVNPEIRDRNTRLQQLKVDQPAFYGDFTPSDELQVSA